MNNNDLVLYEKRVRIALFIAIGIVVALAFAIAPLVREYIRINY
jgi:hypothetical protein